MKLTQTEKVTLLVLMRVAREASLAEQDIVKALGARASFDGGRLGAAADDALQYILSLSGVKQYMDWAGEIDSNLDSAQDDVSGYLFGWSADKEPEQILDDLFAAGEELSRVDHDTFIRSIEQELFGAGGG